MMKKKSWIQPAEAAKYFDVSSSVIREWINSGVLRAAKLPTGHLRILARDVVRRLLQEGKSIPAELGNLANKHVLIVDPDRRSAQAVAEALRAASGCKVTVADTSVDAKGLLNGARPDLVLLGVRTTSVPSGNGASDMLILAGAAESPPGNNGGGDDAVAFQVNDILPSPVDERTVVSRVANVLLG